MLDSHRFNQIEQMFTSTSAFSRWAEFIKWLLSVNEFLTDIVRFWNCNSVWIIKNKRFGQQFKYCSKRPNFNNICVVHRLQLNHNHSDSNFVAVSFEWFTLFHSINKWHQQASNFSLHSNNCCDFYRIVCSVIRNKSNRKSLDVSIGVEFLDC